MASPLKSKTFARTQLFDNLMILVTIFIVLCQIIRSEPLRYPRRNIYNKAKPPKAPGNYKTVYIKQQVDHFNFANNDMYSMRYLVADQFWDHNGGPIFFYTGNEGDIAWFCNNTGFMWDIAPDFKALLVFAEHRYYGESMPYGNLSYKDPQHLGYLSAEQALADYAVLITYIKTSLKGAANSPVIAFGGSYGGMLAAWFRMKYPNIVAGSLAASAPIWQFTDITPCGIYNKIVTNDFKNAGEECAASIRMSWKVINTLGMSENGRTFLSNTFKLCKPLQNFTDVETLKAWLTEAYSDLAMVDYPYPANFLQPLPAWPVKVVCSHLTDSSAQMHTLIENVAAAVSVYFNYTGQTRCNDLDEHATSDLGDLGWDYQACSEMMMPMCADGIDDMFEPSAWDPHKTAENCQKQFGVMPRATWIPLYYGGKNITTSTNIIFSNGLLDPWSGGGVLDSLSETLPAIKIPEGAHHLDLRGANPKDPKSVIDARNRERNIIRQWIKAYYRDL